jgi:hypothetical protein
MSTAFLFDAPRHSPMAPQPRLAAASLLRATLREELAGWV